MFNSRDFIHAVTVTALTFKVKVISGNKEPSKKNPVIIFEPDSNKERKLLYRIQLHRRTDDHRAVKQP